MAEDEDGGGPPPPAPQMVTIAAVEAGERHTRKQAPKWSMRVKPEMVIGGAIPSWVKSIPAPKYVYETNLVMNRAPAWQMGHRRAEKASVTQNCEIGMSPSSLSVVERKHPTIPVCAVTKFSKEDRPSTQLPRDVALPGLDPGAGDPSNAADAVKGKLGAGKTPHWTMRGRDMWITKYKTPEQMKGKHGGPQGSGSGILYDTCRVGPRGPLTTPIYTLGTKLPSEADLMKVRSPGPCNYGGSAASATKQVEVDGSKKRFPSPSFGTAPRWKGPVSEMVRSGALSRYETGRFAVAG